MGWVCGFVYQILHFANWSGLLREFSARACAIWFHEKSVWRKGRCGSMACWTWWRAKLNSRHALGGPSRLDCV